MPAPIECNENNWEARQMDKSEKAVNTASSGTLDFHLYPLISRWKERTMRRHLTSLMDEDHWDKGKEQVMLLTTRGIVAYSSLCL